MDVIIHAAVFMYLAINVTVAISASFLTVFSAIFDRVTVRRADIELTALGFAVSALYYLDLPGEFGLFSASSVFLVWAVLYTHWLMYEAITTP